MPNVTQLVSSKARIGTQWLSASNFKLLINKIPSSEPADSSWIGAEATSKTVLDKAVLELHSAWMAGQPAIQGEGKLLQ